MNQNQHQIGRGERNFRWPARRVWPHMKSTAGGLADDQHSFPLDQVGPSAAQPSRPTEHGNRSVADVEVLLLYALEAPAPERRYGSRASGPATPAGGLVARRDSCARRPRHAALGMGVLAVAALGLFAWEGGEPRGPGGNVAAGPVSVLSRSEPGLPPARQVIGESLFASPAWSPDRSRVAFVSTGDGEAALSVSNADGTARMLLTRGYEFVDGPAWSPDGRLIAFAGYQKGEGDVYLINGDGTGRLRLTDTPGFDMHPAWSPDGASIAFTSGRNGTADIYVMSSDGTNQSRIDTPGDCSEPAWSGTGTLALVCRTGDFATTIYVASTDRTGWRAITDGIGFERQPAWLADDTTIEFTSDRDGDARRYVVDAAGTISPLSMPSSAAASSLESFTLRLLREARTDH